MSAAPATERLAACQERLRAEIKGDLLFDEVSRGIYATDASFYQIMPLGVVVPRDRADLYRAVCIAGHFGIPLLARGGGTSLTGQSVGPSLILDVSKYMNRLLELNVAERWARVEPGLVCDELNALLKTHGLHFAPDPATSSRANVGGMIANNAAGMRSIRYGMTRDHVVALDVALADGTVLNLGAIDDAGYELKCGLRDREGGIYRGFRELIANHRNLIEERFPKVPRLSSGYQLAAFTGPLPWNMAKIITGSEGTLGVILEAKVKLEPIPRHRGLCVAHFSSISETMRAVAPIVSHAPSAVELLDQIILDLARTNLLTRNDCGFLEGQPAAILIIEAQCDDRNEVEAALKAIADDLRSRGSGYAWPIMLDPRDVQLVWNMRKNGLGLMSSIPGNDKPQPFIEDAAVPLPLLPQYIDEVVELCRRRGRNVSLYAHASVGLIHVRPMLNLRHPDAVQAMKEIMWEAFELVKGHGGAWSGEHGDGIVRGSFIEPFFGPELFQVFREIKRLFDPEGLLNPGKKIDVPPLETNRRFGTDYRVTFEDAMFQYRAEGGFARAVEQCNGVGQCRKTLGGTMCPSYIATRDEEHSTRGRANALRLAMSGQLGPGAMTSDRVREVLDLCLACKACKQECPNNVDMSRLKADFMYQHHQAHGASLRDRMFAETSRLANVAAGAWAPAVNGLLASAPTRALLGHIGIDTRRKLPLYAKERLSNWYARRQRSAGSEGKPRVALFNDTYIEHHEPQIGRAAIQVLEAAGYAVELVSPGCCQRPAISKGFLELARRRGEQTLRNLEPLASAGVPILVCEPSCASALTDDLPDLIKDAGLGQVVAPRVQLIDHFLAAELAAGKLKLPWRSENAASAAFSGVGQQIMVHGHCHQKALYGLRPTLDLLRAIPGATVCEIDAGCCGMAGSFGYEHEHYELSLKVGEDRLFPTLRAAPADAQIVACGFSCRHQIHDVTGRVARHALEYVCDALASTDSQC